MDLLTGNSVAMLRPRVEVVLSNAYPQRCIKCGELIIMTVSFREKITLLHKLEALNLNMNGESNAVEYTWREK